MDLLNLQCIGTALNANLAFDGELARALRIELGDWQDRIGWPEAIFNDVVSRSDFYIQRGFDPVLTEFPAPAFRDGLSVAGFRREPPDLVLRYGPPSAPASDGKDEEGFRRTNLAHDWLQRLETQLRRFIDERMTATTFGPNWVRYRLPNGLHEKWREKKQTAEQDRSCEWPLINYADFADYERVICKRDNWREVFASVFHSAENVRESLQRLYPIRVCTMHARAITQDDELLLYVETRRLSKILS